VVKTIIAFLDVSDKKQKKGFDHVKNVAVITKDQTHGFVLTLAKFKQRKISAPHTINCRTLLIVEKLVKNNHTEKNQKIKDQESISKIDARMTPCI